MKKQRLFCLLLAIIFIGSSFEKEELFNDPEQFQGQLKSAKLISPKIKIAVLPDIHYMHPGLLPDQLRIAHPSWNISDWTESSSS